MTPAEHATLSEHAYAELRRALMSGRFEPGEKLTLRGLSAQLGISPTPIREALRRLSAEQGVEIAPNRFIRIPLMQPAEIAELRDIRLALEGLAVERAVAVMTDVEIGELTLLEDRIRALRGGANAKPVIAAIRDLHFAIYRGAAMPSLLRTIESLWLRTAPYVNLLFPDYATRERGHLRAELLAAISARDALRARAALEADVSGALNYIIRRLERRDLAA